MIKDYSVKVIRSDRKSVSIETGSDVQIVVRVPKGMNDSDIERLLLENDSRIRAAVEKSEARKAALLNVPKLSPEEIDELKERARAVFAERSKHFAAIVGVEYGNITVRLQKSRWGSCSSGGNLSFNCLLLFAPPRVLDYVVVHELCHIKQMNHSDKFWAQVERAMPDYKNLRRWLKENG